MKKLLFAAIAASLLLSSCGKVFYQVYDIEAPGSVEKENALVYENEDCKVMYNLWSEDGNIGFIFKNKTDKDIFVILPQTFFIKNGMAFDYYKNREYRKTESVMVSSGVSLGVAVSSKYNLWRDWYGVPSSLNASESKQRAASTTIVRKENPIVCIPPHSSKEISEYSITGQLIRDCNKKQAYPRKKSIPVTYSKDDSPLIFKNRIAYTFDNSGKDLKYVENEFWISELINYAKKEAISKKKYQECESDIEIDTYVFKMASPHKFYNSYKGSSPF